MSNTAEEENISNNITKMFLLLIKILAINEINLIIIETILNIMTTRETEKVIETIDLEDNQDLILLKINMGNENMLEETARQNKHIIKINKNMKMFFLKEIIIIVKENTKKEISLLMYKEIKK